MAAADDPPLDLIAVGAHPDDLEIACGGTLARLADLGYRVGMVDLTDGEPTPGSPGPDHRAKEAERAAEILGVAVRLSLNLPNRRLFDGFEERVALAKVFRKYRPRVVVGFGGKTILASPDHYQAMLITDAAVFYSRLSKWDEYFEGLPPHTIANQLSFPIALHRLDTADSTGYIVADISGTLDRKLDAIRAYGSQFPPSKDKLFRTVESMNRYFGLTAGFDAGELFLNYRSFGVDDLIQWAAPRSLGIGQALGTDPLIPTSRSRGAGPFQTPSIPPSDRKGRKQVSWTNWLKRLWQSPSPGGLGSTGPGQGASSMPAGASSVRLRVGVVTTVGNHREHNEDNFFVPGFGSLGTHPEGLKSCVDVLLRPADLAPTNIDNGATSSRGFPNRPDVAGPFLVADGMGGQLAGEQASRIAVEVIPKELALRLNHENDQEAIRLAIAAANREIIAQSQVDPDCSHMGTTVVLALFRPGRVLVAGIGDSRVYRLRGQNLDRLTRDHDLASALISAGTIRPEEAKNHQFRHVLYLYLGSPEARDGPEDVRSEDLQAGDRFVLASDGLTGSVSDEELLHHLGRRDDPQTIANDLVQLALKNESRDNVTCLVISVEPLSEAS